MTRDNKGNVTLKSNLTPAQLADPNYIKLKGELEGRANAILNRKRGGGGSRYEIQEQ
jgi:hypothetical protein